MFTYYYYYPQVTREFSMLTWFKFPKDEEYPVSTNNWFRVGRMKKKKECVETVQNLCLLPSVGHIITNGEDCIIENCHGQRILSVLISHAYIPFKYVTR